MGKIAQTPLSITFVALVLCLISSSAANAKAIYDLSKLYEPSTHWMGIVFDKLEINNDSTLLFYGHIDPKSKVIAHVMSATNSLSQDFKSDMESKYHEFGAEIDASKFLPLGKDIIDSEHYFWDILKANIIAGTSSIIHTYKLEDELLSTGFNLKITIDGNDIGMNAPMVITISTNDYREACNILSSVHGLDFNLEKILIEKYSVLRGARLNKRILPVEFTSGIELTDISIVDNHLIYNCVVDDKVKSDFEDINKVSYYIGCIGLLLGETADNARKIKGFPMLGFKITYNWYSKSSISNADALLASVTFQYPSVQEIDIFPMLPSRELIGPNMGIGYTDEDVNKLTPITTSNWNWPVDLGLSVNWYPCNLNASKPNEAGCLLGWGDLEINNSLSPMDHNGYNAPDSICGNKKFDAMSVLEYKSGHIPSLREWKELFDNCIIIKTKYEGIEGFKFIGPSGYAIFIPVTDFRDADKLYASDSCLYWIGVKQGELLPNQANAIMLDDIFNVIVTIPITRGLPIRGVQ